MAKGANNSYEPDGLAVEHDASGDDSYSDDSFQSAPSVLEDRLQSSGDGSPPLLQLPTEVLHYILTFLDLQPLISIIRTCRRLKQMAEDDVLWLSLLREQLPRGSHTLDSSYPSPTYRHLFATHFPYWFLPRNKIWISNDPHVGKLILCKFDGRRGCIEGYRLLAERGPTSGFHWPYKPSVLVHTFTPRVHLWLDDPVLKLPHGIASASHGRQGWWDGEITMSVGREGHNTSASFFLARNIPKENQAPSMELWPPRSIPDMPRIRAASGDNFMSKGHKPQRLDQISQTSFRLRQWSQFFTGMSHVGVRLGEEVSTWSTIDPKLYTPTKEKPYQGIFVGDYAGHGCEFLLVMQTERAPPPPARTPSDHMHAILRAMQEHIDNGPGLADALAQAAIDRQASAVPNLDDDVAHSGALEAIKLTGDPNVPRGEHTFIADDLGRAGLIRIATEDPFRGARVVKSRGHVAARGFQNDEFIPSQLLLINTDTLAQYWVPFGHISFYERVDIDALLAGKMHRRSSSLR